MKQVEATKKFEYDHSTVEQDTPRRGIHSHSYHELYFLESGEVTYFIENQIVQLKPGEMIFIPCGVMHCTNYEKLPVSRRVVYVDESFVRKEVKPYIERLLESRLVTFPPEKLHYVRNVFNRFDREAKREFEDSDLMMQLQLEELLFVIERYRNADSQSEVSGIHRTVQDVASYISANVTDDLRLDVLAERFNISSSHLSKQFKILTGVGLNEYINLTRVNASESLLLNTNLSITEIAFKCGFNDSNYFTRVFKKHKGITPKAYSKQKW